MAGALRIHTPAAAPGTEWSQEFLQGMVDRMAMSYFKYGPVADGFPSKIDAVASLKLRLDKYAATGNTEFLMDAANFAMIEFMRPRHPRAHFKNTDSNESPGRIFHGEQSGVPDPNTPKKEHE